MFHCDCIKFNIAQFSVYFGLWCSSCMGGVFVYLSGSCRLVFRLCTSSLFFPLWLDWLHLYYVLKESWVSRSFDYVKKKKKEICRNQKRTANNTWLCFFFFSLFFPGLISRDQETDGQTWPSGPSSATVVSRRERLGKCGLTSALNVNRYWSDSRI